MAPRKLRRSSPVLLAALGVVGLAAGGLVRPVMESANQSAPTVSWIAPLVLFILAAVLGERAWATYQSLHKRNERQDPHRAIRLLALAKAAALVGAVVAGYYLGFAVSFAGDLDLPLPRERVIRSAVAFVAAVLVVLAALALERSCEAPHDDDDEGTDRGRDANPS